MVCYYFQTYPPFWPSEREKRKKYGPVFTVELVSSNHYPNIKTWIFRILKRVNLPFLYTICSQFIAYILHKLLFLKNLLSKLPKFQKMKSSGTKRFHKLILNDDKWCFCKQTPSNEIQKLWKQFSRCVFWMLEVRAK